MANPQFNVVVDGTVLEGFESGAVLLQLQQQLNLPAAKAQQLLAGNVVTVKRAVDEAIAISYCKRLSALGVGVRIEPIGAETAAAIKPPPTRNYFSAQLSAREATNSRGYASAMITATAACLGNLLGYSAIALLSCGLFLFYLVHFAYLLTAPPIVFSICVYLVPLTALLILATVSIRPFLPLTPTADHRVLLSPVQQPTLYAFVAQLCNVLALQPPQQIALTAATQNTLALLPGLKNFTRGDYCLTISLPLLENTRPDQFAALLAADLATQAGLPALRYHTLATAISARLQACLSSRDVIAQRIENLAAAAPSKLLAVLNSGRKLCGQSNQLLQKFAARNARVDAQCQCATLHEQDRYCALVAGSTAFTDILLLRNRLDAAAHDANAKNIEDRIDGGLVDDLPALIRHYYEGLDEQFARNLQRRWETEPTPRRGEPPIARERIEQVLHAAHAGIFHSEESTQLLQQRDALAREVTRNAYASAGLAFDTEQLLPVEELTYTATQDMLQRQQAVVYFNDWLRPFRFWSLAEYSLIREMPLQDAAMQLGVCVNEIRRLTPDRAKLLAEYERLQNQLREILLAQHVLAAGKKFAFRYVNYDGTTLIPLLEDRQQALTVVMEKLSQQEAVMGGRITLGLRLSGQSEREVHELHDALRLLHDIGTRLYKLSLDCFQLEQLLQRQYQLREADYSLPVKKLETKIDDACTLLIVRLNDIPYPLDSRHSSLKSFVESILAQPATRQRSPILQRAQRLLDALYRVNEKLSRQAAEYGTIAEEAYRIEPIKLIGRE